MEVRRAATDPNCRCSPWIAAVRVSGGAPDEEADAADVAGCLVCGGGAGGAPDDGCGDGAAECEGAADVSAIGSMVSDTKLLGADLRRL
jgi:hypothetical protein